HRPRLRPHTGDRSRPSSPALSGAGLHVAPQPSGAPRGVPLARGGDEDSNLAVLCTAHHLQGIHRGRLRCHPLPGGLLAWEFAPADGGAPLARFVEDVGWTAARAAVASEIASAAPAPASMAPAPAQDVRGPDPEPLVR